MKQKTTICIECGTTFITKKTRVVLCSKNCKISRNRKTANSSWREKQWDIYIEENATKYVFPLHTDDGYVYGADAGYGY